MERKCAIVYGVGTDKYIFVFKDRPVSPANVCQCPHHRPINCQLAGLILQTEATP